MSVDLIGEKNQVILEYMYLINKVLNWLCKTVTMIFLYDCDD